jgi:hypothetical protein
MKNNLIHIETKYKKFIFVIQTELKKTHSFTHS